MSFSTGQTYPGGHPVSPERARELMSGDLGAEYFRILQRACAPIYWHVADGGSGRRILANGTLTFVQSPERVFGVTAAHVIADYQSRRHTPGMTMQLNNAVFTPNIIARSDRLDLVTLDLPPLAQLAIGKEIAPVSLPRPHDEPQEGRGIMICGYPGTERNEQAPSSVGWGMFGAVGVARRVNGKQITWRPDHEHHIDVKGLPKLPPNKDLGGISGGPLIAWFEKAGGLLAYYSLAGIVVEASAALENVVAIRSEFIRPDGTLSGI